MSWLDAAKPGQCVSTMASHVEFDYASENINQVFISTTGLLGTATKIVGVQINGYIFASTSSTLTSSESLNTSSLAATNSAEVHSNSLSSGAIAGIAIGAVAVGFAISGIIGFFLLRKYRMRAQLSELSVEPKTPNPIRGRYELAGEEIAHELDESHRGK